MKIIFHYPHVLTDNPSSGSQLRPRQMQQAFQALGYEVCWVAGTPWQRRRVMRQLRQAIQQDPAAYQCVYAEIGPLPNALSGYAHLPVLPNVDHQFLKFCRQQGLKIGLFYRDIYWNVPSVCADLPFWKRWLLRYYFKLDLSAYARYIDILYVPHENMLPYMPVPDNFSGQVRALPPGAQTEQVASNSIAAQKPLHLLYVGGVGALYRVDLLLEAMRTLQDQSIVLDLCCRAAEWQAYRQRYNVQLPTNVRVHHLAHADLAPLYQQADIACLFLAPHVYRHFAMPVKLFEYLGQGKPIAACAETAAGEFIAEHDIGWAFPYDATVLADLLHQLCQKPALWQAKAQQVKAIVPGHTWQARAHQVVQDL